MASKVSICSNALLMLGAQPIASFTEGSDRALLASNLYPAERKAFMRSHNWGCLTVRVNLAPMAEAPAFGYTRQFALPGDCIRLLDVGEEGETLTYRVERRRILHNGTVLPVRYIADLDEGDWDDAMVHAMTLRMAALFAYPITASSSMADAMAQKAKDALRDAKTTDGQEDDTQAVEHSPLLDSRYAGGGW